MPEEKNKLRLVVDTNVWVSFAIGKQMAVLGRVVLHPTVEVYASKELLEELKVVLAKPKIRKYVSPTRAKEALRLIRQSVFIAKPQTKITVSRDPKDDFLLALAYDCQADYLVTGDNDLLSLQTFRKTEIITLKELAKIFFI